ncbi:MAG TPA: hypothetical protein VHL53_05060 [Acidimicrobiia bacterium]|nr:hypothetical protein [Acidimicrobiia bacterium]
MSSITLLIAGVVGYKLTHKGPPSFRRGGTFAIAGGPTSSTATSATAETTATTAAAAGDPTVSSVTTGAPGAPATTATTARKAAGATATTATSGPGAVTPTTRAASGPSPTPTPSATGPARPAPAPEPATFTPGGKPALGTYTWTVDGTEGASFVGNRKFPDKMSMVVHAGQGLKPDQLVMDLTYSDKHAEREIVGFRSDGIYFDFEGGSVTFGPRTETSQADYEPPILEIPSTLQAGFTRSGVTQAKGANGSVSRTEDWKTTVVGQEPVNVAGTTVNAWKVTVERKIRPGTADQGFRNRTMWFDPARNMWVKFVEVFHGERHTFGTSFSYDSNATAVLASFTP